MTDPREAAAYEWVQMEHEAAGSDTCWACHEPWSGHPRLLLAALDAADPLRALFRDGGPDTPCRTTWPDGIECVEVPMADLRAACGGTP